MNNEEKYTCIAQVTGRAVQAPPATVGTSQSQLTVYLKPPSQVPGTVVSSNFQVPKSAGTVVGEGFGFRQTLNQTNLLIYIHLYIFQLEISTPQVR